jgi:membrane fusion protein, multidrug efflux system
MNDRPAEQDKPLATGMGAAVAAPHHPFAPARRSRWLGVAFRLFVLVLVGGLIAFVANEWDWWVGSAVLQTTDDAYLHADLTPLAAKVPGYVRDIPVRDFQKVKAGELLVQIEDDDYRANLEQAEANVAASEAAIQGIEQRKLLQEALIEQAEAAIQGAEADVTRYHLETVRQQKLLAGGLAGTLQIVEQAIDNEQRAKATLELDRAKLQQEREQINVLDSQAKQARGNLGAQKAARDLAKINLGYTRIVAPVDGMVGERLVQRGQYLSVGTQVTWLAPLPNIWVIANYKETQMTNIRVGQKAQVTVDAFPGAVLHGRVDSWSPASGAQFALLPPDNATGNFTKVVQRIPVKITLEPDPRLADLLRPGMSVIATIDTRSAPPGANAGSENKAP